MKFDAFIILIGGFFVGYALYAAFGSLWGLRGYRRLCGFIGGILLAYGGAGFFGCALSASGSLPATFEWPVGRADQVIQASDGRRVAVHPASGRIQVYDHDWNFLRAWLVHAGGGDFKARLLSDDKLEVWTARGAQHFIFTLDGIQLENSSYPPEDYPRLAVAAGPGNVPTPVLLWPFSQPFVAWSIALAGGLLLGYSDPKRFFKRKKSVGKQQT